MLWILTWQAKNTTTQRQNRRVGFQKITPDREKRGHPPPIVTKCHTCPLIVSSCPVFQPVFSMSKFILGGTGYAFYES